LLVGAGVVCFLLVIVVSTFFFFKFQYIWFFITYGTFLPVFILGFLESYFWSMFDLLPHSYLFISLEASCPFSFELKDLFFLLLRNKAVCILLPLFYLNETLKIFYKPKDLMLFAMANTLPLWQKKLPFRGILTTYM
jgi:hypothetical protein